MRGYCNMKGGQHYLLDDNVSLKEVLKGIKIAINQACIPSDKEQIDLANCERYSLPSSCNPSWNSRPSQHRCRCHRPDYFEVDYSRQLLLQGFLSIDDFPLESSSLPAVFLPLIDHNCSSNWKFPYNSIQLIGVSCNRKKHSLHVLVETLIRRGGLLIRVAFIHFFLLTKKTSTTNLFA